MHPHQQIYRSILSVNKDLTVGSAKLCYNHDTENIATPVMATLLLV